jgi:hypothetical protein
MKWRKLLQLSAMVLFFFSSGCGSSAPTSSAPTLTNSAAKATASLDANSAKSGNQEAAPQEASDAAAGLISGAGAPKVMLGAGTLSLSSSTLTVTAGVPRADEAKAATEPNQRKIVRAAVLDILVADFDKARTDFEKLIENFKGYIAKSDFSGNAGSKRTATWTVRIPAARFQSFVTDVAALGQPQRHGTNAEDVTEEFVDLQADIKNLKGKEAKLNELMNAKAQSFQDVVTWEKEIANVRGEIARREARQQTLARLTAMSTAQVTLRYDKEPIPPPPLPPAPPAGNSVSRTFWASIDALEEFGHALLIGIVALTPWLPLILVLTVAAYGGRRYVRVKYYEQSSSAGVDNGSSPPPDDKTPNAPS